MLEELVPQRGRLYFDVSKREKEKKLVENFVIG